MKPELIRSIILFSSIFSFSIVLSAIEKSRRVRKLMRKKFYAIIIIGIRATLIALIAASLMYLFGITFIN